MAIRIKQRTSRVKTWDGRYIYPMKDGDGDGSVMVFVCFVVTMAIFFTIKYVWHLI